MALSEPQPPTRAITPDVLDEMDQALSMGALFNPESFGSMLRTGDNPIQRWRDAIAAERASHQAEIAELRAQMDRALNLYEERIEEMLHGTE